MKIFGLRSLGDKEKKLEGQVFDSFRRSMTCPPRSSAVIPKCLPVTNVCDFGYLYNRGTVVTCDDAAVLPAITIDLSKANYQEVTPVYSTDINNHIN